MRKEDRRIAGVRNIAFYAITVEPKCVLCGSKNIKVIEKIGILECFTVVISLGAIGDTII